MKNTIKYVALLILVTLIIYGLFAFVLLELNPARWPKDTRELFVITFIGGVICHHFYWEALKNQ